MIVVLYDEEIQQIRVTKQTLRNNNASSNLRVSDLTPLVRFSLDLVSKTPRKYAAKGPTRSLFIDIALDDGQFAKYANLKYAVWIANSPLLLALAGYVISIMHNDKTRLNNGQLADLQRAQKH